MTESDPPMLMNVRNIQWYIATTEFSDIAYSKTSLFHCCHRWLLSTLPQCKRRCSYTSRDVEFRMAISVQQVIQSTSCFGLRYAVELRRLNSGISHSFKPENTGITWQQKISSMTKHVVFLRNYFGLRIKMS